VEHLGAVVKARGIVMTAESIDALEAGRKTQTRRAVKMPPGAGRVVVDPGGTDVYGPGPYLKVYCQDPGPDEATMHPRIYSPFGYPGDYLWVKEKWCLASVEAAADELRSDEWRPRGPRTYDDEIHHVAYYAARDHSVVDIHDESKSPWKSPMFMPRWASRFLLEITHVRVHRLHEMTRGDAIAEGVFFTDYGEHEHQLSIDGGVTWGISRTQRAGWSYRKTTSYDQCLGSPQMAYANEWNHIHGGERWNLKPGPSPWDLTPWVWAYTFRRDTR
jgi:hypothetical protein